jgi:hypothetical protein
MPDPRQVNALLLHLAAEAHAGLIPLLTDRPTAEREAELLVDLRLQNCWIGLYFDSLCHALRHNHSAISPEAQALLLTFGIAQYQTTWTWPWGETWASWFADGRPPEHWLASFAWHQCMAVGCASPEEAEPWLEKARADLARGDWPELSAALRGLLLGPTPPEIRALFSSPDLDLSNDRP